MNEQLTTIVGWLSANSQGVETFIFYTLAALAIPFAIGVVFDRAIIRSGFLLIGVFGAISGLFLLLQAQFIAMAQIMIYAVGITLVVVIALMLTNPRVEAQRERSASQHSVGAFITALMMFVVIFLAVRSEGWPVKSENPNKSPVNQTALIGKGLTTDYALPFEFSSVLLLAALVGAIMLAKAEKPSDALEYSEDAEQAEPNEALTTSSR